MSFMHDSTGVDPDQYPLLPDGWYPFKIYEAEQQRSSKGNDMILAKCQVINDQRYNDMEVWHYVTFLPKEQKGAGISVHFRKCIGVPFGGNDLVEPRDWEGQKFMGKVVTEEFEGKRRNKIVSVSPMDKNNGSSAAPQPATASAADDSDIPF